MSSVALFSVMSQYFIDRLHHCFLLFPPGRNIDLHQIYIAMGNKLEHSILHIHIHTYTHTHIHYTHICGKHHFKGYPVWGHRVSVHPHHQNVVTTSNDYYDNYMCGLCMFHRSQFIFFYDFLRRAKYFSRIFEWFWPQIRFKNP
jgi:hypothetical protein